MPSMSSFHPGAAIEAIDVPQSLTYNWEYASPRQRLSRLYENAKRDQWNGSARLDWSIDVDPEKGLVPDAAIAIYGTEIWQKLDARQIERLRHEAVTWQLCQFLHGEQGALLAAAQITNSVPWYEAKMYGSTQVMDEARHVEVYRRFVLEKLGNEYPVNAELKKLLDQILEDSRWDIKFLGMQIIVEGLALAAFGTLRDTTTNPLLRDLIAYVMEDEARHVAFGVLSLREYCQDGGAFGGHAERGVPGAVIRGVSDAAERGVPAALAASVADDGRVRPLRALTAALARRAAFGELVELRAGSEAASKSVAAALATLARQA